MTALVDGLVESAMKGQGIRPGKGLLVLARGNGTFDAYRQSGEWLGFVERYEDGYYARSRDATGGEGFGATAHAAAVAKWGER